MRRYCFLCLTLLLAASSVQAQSSIFDALAKKGAGKGTVTIHQTEAVRNMVGARSADEKIETVGDKSVLVTQGYRIQVFSGNDQRKSKGEADHKRKQIGELYPKLSTYVSFNAPFWRLRVGDFMTYEEAYATMQQLVESFPAFRRETHIVREEVRVPVN